MENQFDYVKDEFNWDYKMMIVKINELAELCEEINKEYQKLLYNARYISTEFDETNTAEEFRELEQVLTEQYEKLPGCEVHLHSKMPMEVKKHVTDLLHERKIYGIAGHLNPDRVREIQNEIEVILSRYDR